MAPQCHGWAVGLPGVWENLAPLDGRCGRRVFGLAGLPARRSVRAVPSQSAPTRPFPGQPRNVHVHICDLGGAWEREHPLFRDYVRAHPAARDDYAEAKLAALRTWADDRWAYTEAKTGIILDILDAAEQWAAATSWTLPPAGARTSPPGP